VGLINQQVDPFGVLDDVCARAGVARVDHRGASLLDAEANASEPMIYFEQANFGTPARTCSPTFGPHHRRLSPRQLSTLGAVGARNSHSASSVPGTACTVRKASGCVAKAVGRGWDPPAWSMWQCVTKRWCTFRSTTLAASSYLSRTVPLGASMIMAANLASSSSLMGFTKLAEVVRCAGRFLVPRVDL
jgi:hypothetical protein